MTSRILPLLALALMYSSSTAFAPVAGPSKIQSTKLQVLPNPADFGDLSAFQQGAHDFLMTSSTLLSDAAATAAAPAKDPSWWDNYLQVFRNILVFVHSTVDQPLKNLGIENTWGISIALFTMSK